MSAISLLLVALVNAVPLYGVHFLGWSAITVLLLYWFENLLIAVTTSLRIALHRRWTRKRGHWRSRQLASGFGKFDGSGSLLSDYEGAAFTFTIVHGIFVAIFIFAGRSLHPDAPLWQPSLAQFLQGAACIALFGAIDLAADLRTLRLRPFAWIKAFARKRIVRVVVLQLVLILGMAAVDLADGPIAFVYALIAAKLLGDLYAGWLERREIAEKPPAWFVGFAGAVGQLAGTDESPLAMWQQMRQAVLDAAREDEETQPQ